jgi:hypothetical protein
MTGYPDRAPEPRMDLPCQQPARPEKRRAHIPVGVAGSGGLQLPLPACDQEHLPDQLKPPRTLRGVAGQLTRRSSRRLPVHPEPEIRADLRLVPLNRAASPVVRLQRRRIGLHRLRRERNDIRMRLNQNELVEPGVVTAAGCGRMTRACGMHSGAGIRPPSSSGGSGCGWRPPGGSPAATRSARSPVTCGSPKARCGAGTGPGATAGLRRCGRRGRCPGSG